MNLDGNALCDPLEYYVLGSHECQWNFGIVISGKMRGQAGIF